jgi:hypothetical protein
LTVISTATTGTIAVTTQPGCAWSSSSAAAWMTLTTSGSGNGSAAYTIAQNTGTTVRTGTLTVAGKTVAVTQRVKPRPPANPRIVK